MSKESTQTATQSGARSARGARARAGLKAAALVVLEREGYHKMRIADVTREAGVAQGLFYHYFKDLKSLTLEVLTDFALAYNDPQEIEKDVPRGDWYARIYAHNLVVVKSYAKRPGIMRCLLQLADEEPEFSGMLRETYRNQLMWLVDLMPKLFPDVRFRKNQALMVVYSLAGIGEGLLREYFVNESKTLRAANLSVEAFAELLHARARRDWGYAADESLNNDDLIAERYRGIRPAFGYPACPDHLPKRTLFQLLDAPEVGIELTETCAMTPAASVSGLYFAHPDARYFTVGRLGRDQIEDYAGRTGLTTEEAERWLASNLGY